MSDHDLPEQVLAAARDDLAAFRPDRTPPFAALQARKRRRDARRGGPALAATALAVAGVAVVPSALTGGASSPSGRDTQVYAAPSPSGAGVDGACDATVPDGACSDGGLAPNRFYIRYDLQSADDDEQFREPEIKECVALPGVTGTTTEESLPPKRTVEVQGDRAQAFLACARAIPGVVVTADSEAAPPEAQDGTRYGVGVGWGDDPGSYDDAAEAAVQRCFSETGLEELSTLTSLPPSHSGKITGKAAADALKTCIADGAPGATVFLTPLPTPAQQAFIKNCLGRTAGTAVPAPDYVGRTYEDVAPPNEKPVNPVRVVGRDGECLPGTKEPPRRPGQRDRRGRHRHLGRPLLRRPSAAPARGGSPTYAPQPNGDRPRLDCDGPRSNMRRQPFHTPPAYGPDLRRHIALNTRPRAAPAGPADLGGAGLLDLALPEVEVVKVLVVHAHVGSPVGLGGRALGRRRRGPGLGSDHCRTVLRARQRGVA